MSKKEEKKKNLDKNVFKFLENYYNIQEYRQAYDALTDYLKENTLTLPLIIWKVRLEFQLKKYEDCLNSCNFLLFLQPNNMECHQIKINVLKIQQKFNCLSDSLVVAMTLFPNASFS